MTRAEALAELIALVEAGSLIPPSATYLVWGNKKAGLRRGRNAILANEGSLDAAKALHEAVLPGWGWGAGGWGARVWLYSDSPIWNGSERQEVEMTDAPARAWLLAILRALHATEGGQP
jgi:hypothetical protein